MGSQKVSRLVGWHDILPFAWFPSGDEVSGPTHPHSPVPPGEEWPCWCRAGSHLKAHERGSLFWSSNEWLQFGSKVSCWPDSMFSCERPQQVVIITERKTVINQGTSQIHGGNIRWAAHGSLGIPAAGFKMLSNGMLNVRAQGSKQMLCENFPKVSSAPHRRLGQADPRARSGYYRSQRKPRPTPLSLDAPTNQSSWWHL